MKVSKPMPGIEPTFNNMLIKSKPLPQGKQAKELRDYDI